MAERINQRILRAENSTHFHFLNHFFFNFENLNAHVTANVLNFWWVWSYKAISPLITLFLTNPVAVDSIQRFQHGFIHIDYWFKLSFTLKFFYRHNIEDQYVSSPSNYNQKNKIILTYKLFFVNLFIIFMEQAFFPRMSQHVQSKFRLTSVHWPLDADF